MNRRCGRITGGIRYLYFFLPESVSVWGQRLCCPVVAAPQLKPNERFYLWKADVDSKGLRETSKDSKHGVRYEQQLNFKIKGNRIEITNLVQMLRHKRMPVIIEDYQGEMLLIMHAKIQTVREIAAARTGFKGTTFTLNQMTRLPLAHVKKVSKFGVIDCSQPFEPVDLRYVDTSAATVIADDTGMVLMDDAGNVISSDL